MKGLISSHLLLREVAVSTHNRILISHGVPQLHQPLFILYIFQSEGEQLGEGEGDKARQTIS